MSDEFQPDNWPEEYFENPPLEQIIGHGNDRGTIDVYRCEDGLVWHTTHEKCDYHGPTGPRTKANFRLTDVQEFAIAKDLASHLPPTQRRALLAHLLKAEGLPGVEDFEDLSLIKLTSENRKRWIADNEDEIEFLRRELDEARATLQRQSESHADEVRLKRKYYQKTREQAKQIQRLEQLHQDAESAASGMSRDLTELGEKAERYRSALEDIDNLSLERGLNHIHGFDELYYVYSDVSDAVDIVREALSDSDNDAKNSRQARLHELLEAEVRERGLRVLPEYKLGKQNDPEDRWWMTCILVRDKYSSIGTVRRDGHPSQYSANLDGIGTIGWYDTPEDAMEAALAEKRRRESEVSDD